MPRTGTTRATFVYTTGQGVGKRKENVITREEKPKAKVSAGAGCTTRGRVAANECGVVSVGAQVEEKTTRRSGEVLGIELVVRGGGEARRRGSVAHVVPALCARLGRVVVHRRLRLHRRHAVEACTAWRQARRERHGGRGGGRRAERGDRAGALEVLVVERVL